MQVLFEEFEDFLRGVALATGGKKSARSFMLEVEAKLREVPNLEVEKEVPVVYAGRKGRVDFVVTIDGVYRVGMELDRRSPRKRSLLKLGRLGGGYVMLREISDVLRVSPLKASEER